MESETARVEQAEPVEITQQPVHLDPPGPAIAHAGFGKALGFGAVAAIVASLLCSAVDAGVQTYLAAHPPTSYTPLALGLLLIKSFGLLAGFLIAKAMMTGPGLVGGKKYQFTALALTYLAISMAAVPVFLWQMHAEGKGMTHASGALVTLLLEYGLMSPLLAMTDITSGIIGLIFLGFSLWIAWRGTRARIV